MPHPIDVEIGKRIRRFRELRGLTQANVAEKLGLSFQQLQKYETGHNRTSGSRLYELAEIFGIAPANLFPDADVPASELQVRGKDELDILFSYRAMTPDQRQNWMNIGNVIVEANAA